MNRYAARRDRLRKLVRKSGAGALLVTNFTNVTYLTGFTGDDSFLLLTDKRDIIISDPRYTTQLEGECPGVELAIRAPGKSQLEITVAAIAGAKLGRVGVEADSMTVAFHGRLAEKASNCTLVATSGIVEQLRAIKDHEEIAEIVRAARYAEKGFAICAKLRPDRTEREIAYELEHQLRLLGAKGCSFAPIIAVGDHAALPHARPTDRRIEEADFVLIDWGATAGLYKSDLTRVLVTGKIAPKLERVYRVVLAAQQHAISAIRPGIAAKDVDAAARNFIADAGFGRYFGHGLGHGLGLDIHEAPRLAANSEQVLKSGMVVTVEPGIYLPGWGGVRIEDDVLVTKSGCEVITDLPKELEQMVVT